jgi:hypothetical protein
MRIHENAGLWIAKHGLGGPSGRTYHLGQLLYGLGAMGGLAAGLALLFWRSNARLRGFQLRLAAALFVLVFSAVVVDYAHASIFPKSLEVAGEIFEEFGEALGATLLLWWAGQSPRFLPLSRIGG